jgi:hypothetical protein
LWHDCDDDDDDFMMMMMMMIMVLPPLSPLPEVKKKHLKNKKFKYKKTVNKINFLTRICKEKKGKK